MYVKYKRNKSGKIIESKSMRGSIYKTFKKKKARKRVGSMVSVLFKKGTSRWRKYFKSQASASRAKRGLKSVGWYC
jgi:hypothetical protein